MSVLDAHHQAPGLPWKLPHRRARIGRDGERTLGWGVGLEALPGHENGSQKQMRAGRVRPGSRTLRDSTQGLQLLINRTVPVPHICLRCRAGRGQAALSAEWDKSLGCRGAGSRGPRLYLEVNGKFTCCPGCGCPGRHAHLLPHGSGQLTAQAETARRSVCFPRLPFA